MQLDQLDDWFQSVFNAGLAAYRVGLSRQNHPFSPTTHSSWLERWQIGWDTGALENPRPRHFEGEMAERYGFDRA